LWRKFHYPDLAILTVYGCNWMQPSFSDINTIHHIVSYILQSAREDSFGGQHMCGTFEINSPPASFDSYKQPSVDLQLHRNLEFQWVHGM